MARYTNYDDLLKKWHDLGLDEISKIHKVNAFNHYIKTLPTADVYEEVHGHWVNTDSFDHFKTPIYQCSVCVREVADNYIHLHKYCLHCGAKMDGGKAE